MDQPKHAAVDAAALVKSAHGRSWQSLRVSVTAALIQPRIDKRTFAAAEAVMGWDQGETTHPEDCADGPDGLDLETEVPPCVNCCHLWMAEPPSNVLFLETGASFVALPTRFAAVDHNALANPRSESAFAQKDSQVAAARVEDGARDCLEAFVYFGPGLQGCRPVGMDSSMGRMETRDGAQLVATSWLHASESRMMSASLAWAQVDHH